MIYIVGRRHCGSTILDIVLGNAGNAQGVGELVFGLSHYPHERVTGGGTVATNPFWVRVREAFERTPGLSLPEASRKLNDAFRLRQLPRLLFASSRSRRIQELCELLERLYQAISDAAGKDVIIDSGKRVTQALFLARFFAHARIVHLVRNPASVMSSHLKRARKGETVAFLGRRIEGRRVGWLMCLYLACNWSIGTSLAWWVETCWRPKCTRLRFEDFLKDPHSSVVHLGSELDLDVTSVLERMEQQLPLSCDANIGGNRVRFENRLSVDSQRAAPTQLPKSLRWIVLVFSFPLLRAFGYREDLRA